MKFLSMTTIILSLFSSVASADPLIGIWQTVNDDNGNFGHVKIETCQRVCRHDHPDRGGPVACLGGPVALKRDHVAPT